MGMIGRTT